MMSRETTVHKEFSGLKPAAKISAGGSGSTVVFIGSTPNIGTTWIAFGAALNLAKATGVSVGYICLNLKSSKLYRYTGMDACVAGLDSIRAEMRSGSLSSLKLRSCFIPIKKRRSVHVLYGATQREQTDFYQRDDFRYLLSVARSNYDICIVDVNAYWDNAATITALTEADQRVLVTTPDLSNFQEDVNRGLRIVAPMLGIAPESFLLTINQYSPAAITGMNKRDICRETGMELAAVVGYDQELRNRMNEGTLVDYIMHNKGFIQSIEPLTDKLAQRLQLSHAGSGASRATQYFYSRVGR